MPTASARPWIERHPLAAAVLLAVVPAAAAVSAGPLVESELRKVLYAGAGTLVFGGLLGGMLKLILDLVAANTRRRDDAAGFVTNVLRDLKAVHDRTARARLLIAAHRSAATYGDELRALVEAKVELHNILRALDTRADGIAESTRHATAAAAGSMANYLGSLIDEFRDRYKPIADRQRSYEARAKSSAEQFGAARDEQPPPTLPSFVWDELAKLEHLGDLLAAGRGYEQGFLQPLNQASAVLRSELARVLSGERSD